MRFVAAVALFTASVRAGGWPLDKAPDNLPKGHCLVWPAEADDCDTQWAQFDNYCGQFSDEACEEVDEAWYSQDSSDWEWKAPVWPSDECWMNMTADCKADWELEMKRCTNRGANGDTDGPYAWTTVCDVGYSLLRGYELWDAGDEMTWNPVDSSNFPDSYAPEDMCFDWETKDKGTCKDQWGKAVERCSGEDQWTRDCANIIARWYSKEFEWVTPTKPDPECANFGFEYECVEQFEELYAECPKETDFYETSYMRTNACEAQKLFSDGFGKWFDAVAYADLNLMKKTNLQKMVSEQRPLGMKSHATSSDALWRKQSAVKATSATALLDKPAEKTQKKQQQADHSGYGFGAVAATFGICATVAFAKRHQIKKLSYDYVRA